MGIVRKIAASAGGFLIMFGAVVLGFLWRYLARSQALVQPTIIHRKRVPLEFPCGLCSDCHGSYQPAGEFIERCNGCGEIRELIDGEWYYHWAEQEKAKKPRKNH